MPPSQRTTSALGLGGAQDVLVVDAREDEAPGVEVRLVLLALLDRGLVAVEVRVRLEALDALRDEVAVRHRVADDRDLEALRLERTRRRSGSSGSCRSRCARRTPRRPGGCSRASSRLGPSSSKSAPAASTRLRGVHDLLVADVAVGEDDGVDREVADQRLEVRLRADRDALGVALGAGELRRVAAVGDAGDLRGGEGDNLDGRVVPVHDVEVVEVTARGAHDEHAFGAHGRPFVRGIARRPRRSVRTSGRARRQPLRVVGCMRHRRQAVAGRNALREGPQVPPTVVRSALTGSGRQTRLCV